MYFAWLEMNPQGVDCFTAEEEEMNMTKLLMQRKSAEEKTQAKCREVRTLTTCCLGGTLFPGITCCEEAESHAWTVCSEGPDSKFSS